MILLKDATYIDWDTLEFTNAHILVEEGSGKPIKFLNSLDAVDKDVTIINCKNKYVTKSFACGHHKSYYALATGMPMLEKKPQNFYETLKNIWWPLSKSLDIDMIKLSAYVTAIACAKNGVTFAINHHTSPLAIEGSLQTIADAFNEVGVGHLLSYQMSDTDGVGFANKGIAETEAYLKNNQGLVGLHSSFSLTDKTLHKAVALANKLNTGIHVNIAEDLYDQDNCYSIHNKRVVERFSDFGILDLPKSIFVHGLYLTDDEREQIRNSEIYMVQNTESNLNNNVGQFSSCGIGNNILLGTDGVHSNMLRAAKMSLFAGQLNDTVDNAEIYRRFRNIDNYLNNNEFDGYSENNLVVLDYKPNTSFTKDNFLSHFIYGIEASHVEYVISDGKLIVENRRVVTVNESDIKAHARDASLRLWAKIKEIQ